MNRTRELVVLAVAEVPVFVSVVVRRALSPEVTTNTAANGAWTAATLLVAALGFTVHHVLWQRLDQRLRREGSLVSDDEKKQPLGAGLALVGLAGLLSLAGPGLFERVLGQG